MPEEESHEAVYDHLVAALAGTSTLSSCLPSTSSSRAWRIPQTHAPAPSPREPQALSSPRLPSVLSSVISVAVVPL